jgi:hypothetical protein
MVDLPSRERGCNVHAEHRSHGMEKEDQRCFEKEMLKEDLLGTFPDISGCVDLVRLYFVLSKIRKIIANEERKETAKVDEFVHDKCQDTSNKKRITVFIKFLPLRF